MADLKILFEKALDARLKAYAPYSGFKVGAALLGSKGHIYTGANVENVSYPCGTCAEQAAIAAMAAGGEYEISEMVIVADSKNLITPCGACLQRIKEFANEKTKVHLADLTGIKKSVFIADLMPLAFHEDLKK